MDRIKSFIFNWFYKSHRAEIKRLEGIIKKHELQVPYSPRDMERYIELQVNEVTNGREFKFAVMHTGLSINQEKTPHYPNTVTCRLDTQLGICNMMPETQPELDRARKELVINLARGVADGVYNKFLEQTGWR